jgi:hypothetical protein
LKIFITNHDQELGDEWIYLNRSEKEDIKIFFPQNIYKQYGEPNWILEINTIRIHFIDYYTHEFNIIVKKVLDSLKGRMNINEIIKSDEIHKLNVAIKLDRLNDE